ncbi:MAG: hypothetical protein AAB734_01150 [Patescibacteria group bacterium]
MNIFKIGSTAKATLIASVIGIMFAGIAFGTMSIAHAEDDYGWGVGYDSSGGSDYGSGVGYSGSDNDYGWGVGYDSSDNDYGWGVGYSGDYGSGVGYEGDYGWGVGYEDGCEWSCGDYGSDGCDYSCGDYDYECGCYDNDYDYDYDDEYEDVYYDEESQSYSYGSGGSHGSSGSSYRPSYSSSGYSMVRPMSFSSPSYPAPRPTSGGSVSNVTNTSITNVDNSINDSFNNYNSNNVAYVAPATPQYQAVYTQPAPYCTIRQAQASGYGVNSVYLSWTSTNATSAYLSNVGSVQTSGSQTVWNSGNMVYTLTVYGNGGSATCQTTVNAYNYNPTPYVSLTQIPYTGFDLGTFGNAMYWAGLLVFAMGAGYLAVYYVPALAFAGARRKQYAPVVAPMAPIMVAKEIVAAKVQSIVEAIKKTGTNDAMAIVASKDGSMPKIVISRD